jgi:hypothetical protein
VNGCKLNKMDWNEKCQVLKFVYFVVSNLEVSSRLKSDLRKNCLFQILKN